MAEDLRRTMLPDCMMGGLSDPCEGFTQVADERDRLRSRVQTEERSAIEGWQEVDRLRAALAEAEREGKRWEHRSKDYEIALRQIIEATVHVENSYARVAYRIARAALAQEEPE